MSQRFTAAQAAKLISEWIDNDDNDSVNLDIDDRSDVSEVDNLEIDDRSDEFYDDLPIATHDDVVAAVDVTDDNEADYENCDTIADDVELTDDADDLNSSYFISKDRKIKWYATAPRLQKKRSPADIIRKPAGRAPGVEPEVPSDAFQLFFDAHVFDCILKATEKESQAACSANEKTAQRVAFTVEELKAFIGLLILIGVTRGRNESLDQLWSNEWGRPICRATMSKERFKEFLRFIRFDDKDTRQERRATDKLAAIREIFDYIAEACKKTMKCQNMLQLMKCCLVFGANALFECTFRRSRLSTE
jgi:hypothetical protein